MGNVVVVLRAVCTWFLGDEVCGMSFVPLKYLRESPANSTLCNWDVAGMLMPKSLVPGFWEVLGGQDEFGNCFLSF